MVDVVYDLFIFRGVVSFFVFVVIYDLVKCGLDSFEVIFMFKIVSMICSSVYDIDGFLNVVVVNVFDIFVILSVVLLNF